MSKLLEIVAVSGGLKLPSRTLVVVERLLGKLGEAHPIDTHLIELSELSEIAQAATLPA